MEGNPHIINFSYAVNKQLREGSNGHKGACLWFEGLSGAGKSTLANGVEGELFKRGVKTFSLDGDNVRKGLSSDLGFSESDRIENLRRIGEVAKLMCDAGLVVTAAFISPYKKDRHLLRNLLGAAFFEFFVDTPLEVCEQRDVKGLYKKARAGEIKNFTGISLPFERPDNPDMVINTVNQSIDQSVSLILDFIWPKLALS